MLKRVLWAPCADATGDVSHLVDGGDGQMDGV
jgi:hypothetical protein